MKNSKIVIVFPVTAGAVLMDYNIGDNVRIKWTNIGECYTIMDGDNEIAWQPADRDFNQYEYLVNYLSKQKGITYLPWDEEYSDVIDGSYGTIEAIDQNYIIVRLCDDVQNILFNDLFGHENRIDVQKDDALEVDFENILNQLVEELNLATHEALSNECENVCCEEREDKDMFTELGTSFGKLNGNQFRLSINGLAVRGKDGKYVTFNPDTRELVEVTTGFFDDMKDLLFVMPTTELEVGDIILHQNKPYYISAVADNVVKGIDFEEAVESTLVPKTNVFGMKYFTKVFNCLGTNNILGTDIASNPMMAYALMGGKDFDLSKIMMFQALGNGKGIADFSENPMMLMALMSNESGNLSDFAKYQMLSQLGAKKASKETKKATVKEN